MIYPLVRELAVDGIPVTVTCRVLRIARQPYYQWPTVPVTGRELVQAHRANALFHAYRDDPQLVYRLLGDEAAASGQPMAERTAWAICAANRWWSASGRPRRGKGGRPGPPVHDDQVNRAFTAEASNQLWLTDTTEHRRRGQALLVRDHRRALQPDRRLSLDSRMKSRLAATAIDKPRRPTGRRRGRRRRLHPPLRPRVPIPQSEGRQRT
jgi:hypothetical protein